MEINVLEEKSNRLVFETDESVGFVNALKNELWNDSHVKVATHFVKHPLLGKVKVIVETDGADPRKTINSAISKLKKQNEKFAADVKKEIK